MRRASGGSDTSHWNRNDIPDFQGAISMIVSIENGKACNQTTMRRDWRDLVRNGLLVRQMVWTGLCREDKERIQEHHHRHGSSTLEKDEFEICRSEKLRTESVAEMVNATKMLPKRFYKLR